MAPIKSVCISATQSGSYLSVSASVGDYEEDRRYGFRMEWDLDNPPRVDSTSTEWLYKVLSRVLESYDDHDVTDVRVEGVELMREEIKNA